MRRGCRCEERPRFGSAAMTSADTPRTRELSLPLGRVEEHVERIGGAIGHRRHDVGRHHVVDVRDVLVTDALDVVLAEAVAQQGRAFQRFDGNGERSEPFLQRVSRGERSGRTRRRHERAQALVTVGCAERLDRSTRRQAMGQVVAELAELVQHHVRRVAFELSARVVDLLHVALRPRRAHDVFGIVHPSLEPLEALPAHVLGQHCHTPAAHDARDRDAAARVVAGRGPDRAMSSRVELAGDHPRGEARVRGLHLVRTDHRESVAEREHDRGVDPCQLGWNDEVAG